MNRKATECFFNETVPKMPSPDPWPPSCSDQRLLGLSESFTLTTREIQDQLFYSDLSIGSPSYRFVVEVPHK